MRQIAWVARLVGIVAAAALMISAVFIGAAPRAWGVANAHLQVPVDLPDFESLSQRTFVYGRDGALIATFERENSQPISLSQVPPDVVKAVLAIEDNEFYLHHGVNVRSLIRATLSNFSSDAPRQGASTITQQVVKNEYLAGLDRDGRYKLLQINYARWLEKEKTKDEILERYLNTIFFGNNAYGLQAAAEIYFGKSVEQLTMIEGAFLAGLVRSPSGYDPINRPERARARFVQVTERLADVGMLTPEEAESIGAEFQLPEQVRRIATYETVPTYYTAALRQYLLERSNILGETEQERANLLYRGGLRIYTTFDSRLQQLAEQARTTLPETAAGIDAAVVTLDSRTGAIRAMVGGSGYVPHDNEINMALVPRQTGSAIKFFVLAAALQAGAQPNDVIDARLPCTLPNPGEPTKPFEITNGVSRGVVPLADATFLSLNCAFARLSQIVGLNRVVAMTYRMARSPYLYQGQPRSDREPLQPYASFATGANEMRPLDMASGAQTLANGGLHHEPYYVERIERADGEQLYVHDDPGVQVLDPQVALSANSILTDVIRRGTARSTLGSFPYPAAGKTGTQVENTNSWFVGYTPELSTAVWVGDPDKYTPMDRIPEFVADGVEKVQGGTYPAAIWGALMEPAIAAMSQTDWAAPTAPARPAMRLYLPGDECLFRPAPLLPDPIDPAVGAPPPTTGTPTPLPSATTIPPTVLDPRAQLALTSLDTVVTKC